MPIGKVEFYNKVRQYGFIITEDIAEYNMLFNGDYDLQRGDIVEFDTTAAGEKGPKAVNIRKVENE
jgi:cold shock CspA family protein